MLTRLMMTDTLVTNDRPYAPEGRTGPPGWFAHLVQFSPDHYGWKDGRLVFHGAPGNTGANPSTGFAAFLVRNLYATHNSSGAIRRALGPLVNDLALDESKVGLNFGAGGGGRLHPRILNLDVQDQAHVDLVTDGGDIPLKDASLDLIVTQEVLEHVADYRGTVRDLARILKPGGIIYCQLPFQIGFHPGPNDYRRFSRQGMEQLFEGPEWHIEQVGVATGHGTAFYRIAVEFCAVTMSALHRSLYRPAKGLSAVLLYPFKLFDGLTERSSERDRIAGGYYAVARRTDAAPSA
ncbi:class I SAM-dependent methyltransferase [Brevundimonas sp.]|uniref:class I SAM-dependent methyltransferase n=1 Tax=Brevundimonas sp. TaxID=1871086 RepID=UPI003F722FFD